jgi:hypothetical protein
MSNWSRAGLNACDISSTHHTLLSSAVLCLKQRSKPQGPTCRLIVETEASRREATLSSKEQNYLALVDWSHVGMGC